VIAAAWWFLQEVFEIVAVGVVCYSRLGLIVVTFCRKEGGPVRGVLSATVDAVVTITTVTYSYLS
jgi:hypothetical protein